MSFLGTDMVVQFPSLILAFWTGLPPAILLSALQDRLIKRCQAITEKISEEVSEVEGEWLTVGDMEKLQFSELLSGKYSDGLTVSQKFLMIH